MFSKLAHPQAIYPLWAFIGAGWLKMAERKEKVYIRVKLCFEDPPLDTPKCLWYLISTKSCSFISDVCYSIQKRYLGDKDSISLTMDDYAVPMEESVHLLKDNDVLRLVCVILNVARPQNSK